VWGLRGALLAVVVVTSCSGGGGGGGGAARDAGDDFCKVLNDGAQKLDANTASADSSLSGQFALVLQNLGEYTALLHRLAPVTPPDIKTDMTQAVKAWDAQADALGKVASDPLGALTAGIVTSVFASGSVKAVDEYALRECGRPIFGVDPATAISSTPQCPSLPNGATTSYPYASALSDDATTDGLRSTLDDLVRAVPTEREAIGTLAVDIDGLAPPAKYAREAIGRLDFDGGNAATTLASIDTAVEQACGVAAFGPSVLEELAELRPRRASGGAVEVSSSMYGTPCAGSGGLLSSHVWPTHPFGQFFNCPDGLAVVDFETGTPRYLAGPSASVLSGVDDAIDRAVWIDQTESAASGLQPVRTSVVLHIVPFDGSRPIDVALVRDQPSRLENPTFQIVHAASDRIVTLESKPDRSNNLLVIRDGNGKTIKQIDLAAEGFLDDSVTDAAGDPYLVAENNMILPSREDDAVLDTVTGELHRLGDGSLRRQGVGTCANAGIVVGDDGRGWLVSVRDDTSVYHALAAGFLQNSLDTKVVRRDVVVDLTSDGSLRARGPDGATRWQISADVVQTWQVLGGWIEVANRSDQKIIVDPTTGKEAGQISTDLRAVLEMLGAEPDVWLVDSSSNTFIISGGSTMRQVPYKELCGN
jgi:hypothetical protein